MSRWKLRKCFLLKHLIILLLFEACVNTTEAEDATQEAPSLLANLTPGSNQTCDRICQLEQILGPSTMDLSYTISMSSFYLIILVTGILGNVITCLVIVFNENMHTATNYYLFSLSISDVIFLLTGLPLELHGLLVGAYPWVFGTTVCILRTWVFEATTMCSILTILTFTFERWLHICHPMYAKKFSNSFSRAIKIILFIWIVSGLSAVPFASTSGVYNAIQEYPESKICYTLPQYTEHIKGILKLSVTLFFLVPMTLMSVMYIHIGIQLWKSHKINRSENLLKINKVPSSNPSRITSKILGLSFFSKPTGKLEKDTKTTPYETKFLTVKFDMHRKSLKNESTDSLASEKLKKKKGISFSASQNISVKEREQLSKSTRHSRRDVVKMLLFVVLGFFICWAPFHIQRVWTTTLSHESMHALKSLLTFVYYVSGISIYISSVINPILYNVMSERYRTAFANTVRMLLACQIKSKPRYHDSHLYKFNQQNIKSLRKKQEGMGRAPETDELNKQIQESEDLPTNCRV